MMPYSPISGTDTTVQGQYVIRPVRQPILSWIESATCVSAAQARFSRVLSSPKWSQMGVTAVQWIEEFGERDKGLLSHSVGYLGKFQISDLHRADFRIQQNTTYDGIW